MVPIGEHRVTREMAIDGGDPAMEGMSMGVEMGPCGACGGTGEVEVCPRCGSTAWKYEGARQICSDCGL